MSTRLLIAYYSAYGHVHQLAEAAAAGAAAVPDVEVRLRRIPELHEVGEASRAKPRYVEAQARQAHVPEVAHDDLRWADGILWGTAARYGNMSAQMKHFLDTTAAFWFAGELEGLPAGVFTSTGTIHSGQESTLLTSMVPLLHLGMIVVGLGNHDAAEMLTTDGIGGTPYGATTLSGMDGRRPVDPREERIVAAQAARLARVAALLRPLRGGRAAAAAAAAPAMPADAPAAVAPPPGAALPGGALAIATPAGG